MSWYSGNEFDQYTTANRMFGPYAPIYWVMLSCNCLVPQLLWIQRVRMSPVALFILALLVNVGMWTERFVIVVTSLHRDFMPSSWGMYTPTVWDWMTFIGTLGLFLCLLFLFVRLLPMISIYEMRTMLPEAQVKENG
jgi:molybdopterin-containing oxidoreductase family membrane subunit